METMFGDVRQHPNDNRMLSIILSVITLFSIFFLIRNNELKFNNFILNLKNNLKSRKGNMEQVKGPSELIEIKNTLDEFLNTQKEKLEKRLMVLSSISHDIGTPATKLKLRTSLIEDKNLKEKLETDIDNMIEMMNGVLSYTRSEMDLEEEIEISYISLIDSIVFDYQDLGKKLVLLSLKRKKLVLLLLFFQATTKLEPYKLIKIIIYL
jgi:signal transduction histidine kinase